MLMDTDNNPIGIGYYYSRPLDRQYDHSCVSCTRET